MQKILTPLAIIIAGLFIAFSNLYVSGKIPFNLSGERKISKSVSPTPPAPPAADGTAVQAPKEIPVGNSPFLGKADAPVTVVEFSDFQCPFCAAVNGVKNDVYNKMVVDYPGWEPIIPNLKKDYIDRGLVKLVYRDFSFLGEESDLAANAALCAADQSKYWQYHDKIFESQKGENQGALSQENLKGLAVQLSLDSDKFNKCVLEKTYLQEVKDSTSNARTYGVAGTPAFFVNGKVIPGGAVPYSVVKQAIEAELKK